MKVLLSHFLLFLIPLLSFGQNPKEIKFIWKGAESNSQKFEKAIMLIPVKFKSDSTTYFLQFDTGATHSYLYSNQLRWFNSSEEVVKTSIGNIKFREKKLIKATAEKNASIGTLGANWLKDKVVQINFVDQTIKVNYPYKTSDYFIKPLYTLNGRPVIKVILNGKEQKLLYDTGSGLFGIWTNKKNWKSLREKSDTINSFPISSWGEINTGYYSSGNKTYSPILGGPNIKSDIDIWYVDNRKYKRFFRKNKLFGILGNQPFLHQELILDFNSKVFGIKIVSHTR